VTLSPEGLTDEQEQFRTAVREFVRREVSKEYVRRCDEERVPPVELFEAVAANGWLGVNVPEEHGGAGGGPVELAVLLEELGKGFLDLAFWVFRVLTYGGFAVTRDGTAAQKADLLPRLVEGSCSICFALTEPGAGSDAAALATKAAADGDGFVISGQKVFTSGFKVSQYVLVAARTGPDEPKHEGITNFLVPTDAPGLTATPLQMLGHWPLGTAHLYFDDVRVPATAVLGEVGEGWAALRDYLEYERLSLSAARTGAAQAALADAVEYAKTRIQFGRPIGKFQAVSHKLAEMAMLTEAARTLVYRYARQLAAGTATRKDAAILKLFTGEAYKTVADLGLQVLGGYGYSMEYDLQRHYREARLATIGAGTSEIQKNIIARELGL
jgi:acyl-CoA dehydrogenase